MGVKILEFFDEDPGSGIRDGDSSDPESGMEKSRIRDLGSGINIPDPQHCFYFAKIHKNIFEKNSQDCQLKLIFRESCFLKNEMNQTKSEQ